MDWEPGWNEEWILATDREPVAGDVFEVVSATKRDCDGVLYEVRVGLRTLGESAYEEGEDQQTVWRIFVPFGQTDAFVAGGSAFVAAARRQEAVAERWAKVVS